jgi:hypothetical protein
MKFSCLALRQKKVIRCDTGLPGIQALPGEDAFGCFGDGVIRRDDGGRLAAEFQRHRRQILGSSTSSPAGRPKSSR